MEIKMEYIDELENLLVHYPSLEACRGDSLKAYEVLSECFARDGFVFTTGNGGSASDADHIVGELLKGFKLRRPLCEAEKARLLGQGQPEGAMLSSSLQRGFRAMSLMSQTAIYTAAGNDLGGDMGPAQQLNSLGRPKHKPAYHMFLLTIIDLSGIADDQNLFLDLFSHRCSPPENHRLR